jgi:hypothetical protein
MIITTNGREKSRTPLAKAAWTRVENSHRVLSATPFHALVLNPVGSLKALFCFTVNFRDQHERLVPVEIVRACSAQPPTSAPRLTLS